MPELEARMPCPVCLGVKMTKRDAGGELVLDRCERCGGLWFDAGEVARLRTGRSPEVLRQWRQESGSGEPGGQEPPEAEAARMTCHGCHAFMDRNAERCATCGWENVLDCPACGEIMERRRVEGLTGRALHLDVCRDCRGAWFDRLELDEIWNLRASAISGPSTAARLAVAGEVATEIASEAGELLVWNPDLAVSAARAVGRGGEALASVASAAIRAAPGALGTAAEAAGDLAGSVFELIADVIGSLFN